MNSLRVWRIAVVGLAVLIIHLPTITHAGWSPRPRHYVQTLEDYHFIADTPLVAPDGRPYSLCIAFLTTNVASGLDIKGYALSPNACRPKTAFLGLFTGPDPEIVVLSQGDVTDLKLSGDLPADLPQTPQLPIKEKITARFAIYLFAGLFGLLIVGALTRSFIDERMAARRNEKV